MQILVIAFFISSFGCTFVHSIELKCDYLGTIDWRVIGSHYICEIENQEIITDKFNRVVHSVIANHQNSKSNDDVKAIRIKDSTVNFFPRDFDKYFENLEGISIRNSSLKEIRKSDLKPFAELRVLSLHQNQLEVIEANLFDNNPKLEVIYLWQNQISHVDDKVFNKFVGKLRNLLLNDNICQLGGSKDNIQTSNEIIAQIQAGKCKDEDKLAAFYMNSDDGEDLFKAVNQIVENSIKKLKDTLVGKIDSRICNLETLTEEEKFSRELKINEIITSIVESKFEIFHQNVKQNGDLSKQISVFKTKNSAIEDQLRTIGRKQNEINDEISVIKNKIQTSHNEPKSAIQDLSDQIFAVKSQTLDEIMKIKDELKAQKNEVTSALKYRDDPNLELKATFNNLKIIITELGKRLKIIEKNTGFDPDFHN